LTVTAGLIVVYLVVSNATGAGQLLTSAGSAYKGAVTALQGR
jgi:hypothetical protein